MYLALFSAVGKRDKNLCCKVVYKNSIIGRNLAHFFLSIFPSKLIHLNVSI